jgi:biotin operon repressor
MMREKKLPNIMRLFFSVLRKTNGWQKQYNWISGSQFEGMTGITRNNVYRSLNTLKELGFISIKKSKRTVYSVNPVLKNFDSNLHQNRDTKTSDLIHTKETPTKENQQDKSLFQQAKASAAFEKEKDFPENENLSSAELRKKFFEEQEQGKDRMMNGSYAKNIAENGMNSKEKLTVKVF